MQGSLRNTRGRSYAFGDLAALCIYRLSVGLLFVFPYYIMKVLPSMLVSIPDSVGKVAGGTGSRISSRNTNTIKKNAHVRNFLAVVHVYLLFPFVGLHN